MIEVNSYFRYISNDPWNNYKSIYILQVTKVNFPWVTLKTLDNKFIKRKLKIRPSGIHFVEHDAFNSGGRNKFDKVSYEEIIPFLQTNLI